MGERTFHIARALQMIDVEVGPVQASSSYYETMAWGVTDQEPFINIAIAVEYYGTPSKLLSTTQSIERKLGREKTAVWGPRIIDIDILLYDDISTESRDLTIPHRHMAERNFVLFPMAELAPELVHPLLRKTMQELLDECTDECYVTVVNPEVVQ